MTKTVHFQGETFTFDAEPDWQDRLRESLKRNDPGTVLTDLLGEEQFDRFYATATKASPLAFTLLMLELGLSAPFDRS
ncbi:hypothetical protein GRS96_12215 [Rathayibacter sp. VKM Ac-2803]|uniref:hypothetical protein n=1 Tax=Rathayibacter sp. VKM Ac-2803 TaxID=2609256 RepID=UPI00135B1DF0|nr:hypothetical protein [Rathayibacter sp. VKM Ac-2803]MWV50034.1 hypothetical protein [Rathayibacter sp. VKM Ac-2803]